LDNEEVEFEKRLKDGELVGWRGTYKGRESKVLEYGGDRHVIEYSDNGEEVALPNLSRDVAWRFLCLADRDVDVEAQESSEESESESEEEDEEEEEEETTEGTAPAPSPGTVLPEIGLGGVGLVKPHRTLSRENSGHFETASPRAPCIRVKWITEDEIRAADIPGNISYGHLLSRLEKEYGGEARMTYEDIEGDTVTIASHADLELAFRAFRESGKPSLRIHLHVVGGGKLSRPGTAKSMHGESEASQVESIYVRRTISAPDRMTSSISPKTSPKPLLQADAESLSGSEAAESLSGSEAAAVAAEGDDKLGMLPGEETALRRTDSVSAWQRGEMIGKGSFGQVYAGLDLQSGRLLAVKRVAKSSRDSEDDLDCKEILALESEIKLLRTLYHPNIVAYLGTERAKGGLHIFLEYVGGGSIAAVLSKFGAFSESVVRRYTSQVLAGLTYLHAEGIIHRDLKCANMLLEHSGMVKLADFGCSKRVADALSMMKSDKEHTTIGTCQYMAPEVVKEEGYGRSADIWSLGMCVHEMCTGTLPWPTPANAVYKLCMSDEVPPPPEQLTVEGAVFLGRCLEREPSKRPEARALQSDIFLLHSEDPALLRSVNPY